MSGKAVAYLRVSGKSQLLTDGFPRQCEAIERFAAVNGFEIVAVFVERAVSGTTEWESRPAWQAMMAFLNGTRTIIVERSDRVARDLMVHEMIVADLKKRGVTLLTSTGEDTSDEAPTRVLIRQILAAFSEYEKQSIVLKLRAARERKRAAGEKCEGAKEFGKLSGESQTLAAILDLHAESHSCRSIASYLNRNLGSHPTRFGDRWHAASVARILRRSGVR